MSRQYPIWHQVEACIYKSKKSYGAKNDSSTTIHIGSSSSNSMEFVNHRTTRVKRGDYDHFRFSVDGKIIKEVWYNTKTNEFLKEAPVEEV